MAKPRATGPQMRMEGGAAWWGRRSRSCHLAGTPVPYRLPMERALERTRTFLLLQRNRTCRSWAVERMAEQPGGPALAVFLLLLGQSPVVSLVSAPDDRADSRSLPSVACLLVHLSRLVSGLLGLGQPLGRRAGPARVSSLGSLSIASNDLVGCACRLPHHFVLFLCRHSHVARASGAQDCQRYRCPASPSTVAFDGRRCSTDRSCPSVAPGTCDLYDRRDRCHAPECRVTAIEICAGLPVLSNCSGCWLADCSVTCPAHRGYLRRR